MKNILFVMPKMQAGGAEKSLIMFLYLLKDREDVNVDLLLFKHEGLFLNQLPENINIISGGRIMEGLYPKSIGAKSGILIKLKRFFATGIAKVKTDTYMARNQYRWVHYYKKWLPDLEKKYDYAIGYLEGESNYYVVDKVNADVKIGWFQNTIDKQGFDYELERPYINALDYAVCLTDECENIILKQFPEIRDKLLQIPPMINKDFLDEKAKKFEPDEYNEKTNYRFVSVGRLVEQKGFDYAILAAKILKEKGMDFIWYIIGNGELKESLIELIKREGVEDSVRLIGERENPYPYIRKADIFIQPSRFEARSVILTEAMTLCRPIIVCNYATAHEQISNTETGLIVDMNPGSLAEGICNMLSDDNMRDNLVLNLESKVRQNSEVEKMYLELLSLNTK